MQLIIIIFSHLINRWRKRREGGYTYSRLVTSVPALGGSSLVGSVAMVVPERLSRSATPVIIRSRSASLNPNPASAGGFPSEAIFDQSVQG